MDVTASRKDEINISESIIQNVLNYLSTRNIEVLSLGGGEPFYALEKIFQLCEHAKVDEIELFTSGIHAGSESSAVMLLKSLGKALQKRNLEEVGQTHLRLMVSVDEYHGKVPLRNITNLIEAWTKVHCDLHNVITFKLKGLNSPYNVIENLSEKKGWKYNKLSKSKGVISVNHAVQIEVIKSSVKIQPKHIINDVRFKKFNFDIDEEIERISNISGVSLSINHDGRISAHQYLVNSLHLGNAISKHHLDIAGRQIKQDNLYDAFFNGHASEVFNFASAVDSSITTRGMMANNKYLIMSDILNNDNISSNLRTRLGTSVNNSSWRYDIPIRLRYPRVINGFSRVVMEITNHCPVGCEFCWMEAKGKRSSATILSDSALAVISKISKLNKFIQFDITGGEPTTEIELTKKTLRTINAPFFTISTSGNFATTVERASSMISAFAYEVRKKNDQNDITHLQWRLSIDSFHWHVSRKIVKNFLLAYEGLPQALKQIMSIEFRTVSTIDNPTRVFLKEIGVASAITEKKHHGFPIYDCVFQTVKFQLIEQELRLTSNLIINNKITKPFEKLAYKRAIQDNSLIGGESNNSGYIFIDENGFFSMHAFLSKAMPLVGVSHPDVFDVLLDLYECDPLIVTLRTKGVGIVLKTIHEISTDILKQALDANNVYLAIEKALEDNSIKLSLYRKLANDLDFEYTSKQ